MVRREIEIDEDLDRMLTKLALEYQGNVNSALTALINGHDALEAFADESEAANQAALSTLRDKAEADFREGRIIDWEDVKSRNGL